MSEDLDLDTSNFEKVYMILKSEIVLVYKLMASFFSKCQHSSISLVSANQAVLFCSMLSEAKTARI